MKTALGLMVICSIMVLGCSNRENETALQSQLTQAQNDRAAFQQLMAERDKYLEEVMKEVNDIYSDLEKVRAKEGQIAQHTGGVEGAAKYANLDTRQKLLQNITDIGLALKENRKKIGDLQARVKSVRGEIAGLNVLIENLKNSLQEREQSIAQLQVQVQGLEATVKEKTALVAEKEMLLDNQQRVMNRVFYLAATRDELKEKGIITKEGGFLWGLLGSTTVMASGIDTSEFTPLDRTKDQNIHVAGKIAEILPRRSPDFFVTSEDDQNSSDLKILRPEKFWQEHYLVVVLD